MIRIVAHRVWSPKSNILERCYANKNIKGVVLKIDSGGGSGDAMRLMADTISDRNKPVVAFIDDNACSAAYGIASGCDIVVANSNTAYVGSIGTYISIADYTEYLKKEGISIIEVYATASKDKNIEVREALKGNVAPVRKLATSSMKCFSPWSKPPARISLRQIAVHGVPENYTMPMKPWR